MTNHISRGRRITGQERQALGKQLAARYEKGASIRALAESTGRSYGFVHRLLSDGGVELRGRGGAQNRGKRRQDVAVGSISLP